MSKKPAEAADYAITPVSDRVLICRELLTLIGVRVKIRGVVRDQRFQFSGGRDVMVLAQAFWDAYRKRVKVNLTDWG